MSSRKAKLLVSPRRHGMSHRINTRRSFGKGGKKFGTVGSGSGVGLISSSVSSKKNLAVNPTDRKGNITVVVRVRPARGSEADPERRLIVQAVDDKMLIFDPKVVEDSFYFHGEKQKGRDLLKKPNKNVEFIFDKVFGPSYTNPGLFEEIIKPTIDAMLSGCNCSVFAYGATGSGKTYTMLGSNDNPGLTQLTVLELYSRLTQLNDEYETDIRVSYVEVYNEEVRDLLANKGSLSVRDNTNGETIISELSYHKPENAEQLYELLIHGNSIRTQHYTDFNAESSRSHAIFQISVKLRGRYTDMTSKTKHAKLVMVDLAGAEQGTTNPMKSQRRIESVNINQSLLVLSKVITALADGNKHVPYRDSKLTRILKDSLGGNSKTVMIANVSPSDTSYHQTLTTLTYADCAKKIRLDVKKNLVTVNAHISEYKQVVQDLTLQIESLKKELQDKENGCHCNSHKVDVGLSTDIETEFPKNILKVDVGIATDIVTGTAENILKVDVGMTTDIETGTATNILKMDTGVEKDIVNDFGDDSHYVKPVKQTFQPECSCHIYYWRAQQSIKQKSVQENDNGLDISYVSSETPEKSLNVPGPSRLPKCSNDEDIAKFESLLVEKQTHVNLRLENLLKQREIEARLFTKKKRIEGAELLGNVDRDATKRLDKLKKLVENQYSKSNEHGMKVIEAGKNITKVMDAIEECILAFQNTGGVNETLIPMEDYLNYKLLKVDIGLSRGLQKVHEKLEKCLYGEVNKSEMLLCKSLTFVKPMHQIMKNLGHTTQKMEKDYQNLMKEFLGSSVHFDDTNKENAYKNSPLAKTPVTKTYRQINNQGNRDDLSKEVVGPQLENIDKNEGYTKTVLPNVPEVIEDEDVEMESRRNTDSIIVSERTDQTILRETSNTPLPLAFSKVSPTLFQVKAVSQKEIQFTHVPLPDSTTISKRFPSNFKQNSNLSYTVYKYGE